MMTDRGVSVTLDYVILFMVAAVVLAGVATVSGTMIANQVDRGVEDELSVTGERLAADVQDVEQLVNASGHDTTLTLESDLPRHVSGEGYRISIQNDGSRLVLEASTAGIVVETPVAADRLTETDGSISGGPVRIVVDNGDIEVLEHER